MRLAFLLLASTAYADDVRLHVHAGAGVEAGLIQGKPRPDFGVAELGVGIDRLLDGKNWGFGLAFARVGRSSSTMPIASEHKLDLFLRFSNSSRTIRGGWGVGLRRIVVDGTLDRPASTLHGFDLFCANLDLRVARGLDMYFGWSFGLYHGDLYSQRHGDMPHTKREETTLSNAYVIGIKGSLDL